MIFVISPTIISHDIYVGSSIRTPKFLRKKFDPHITTNSLEVYKQLFQHAEHRLSTA